MVVMWLLFVALQLQTTFTVRHRSKMMFSVMGKCFEVTLSIVPTSEYVPRLMRPRGILPKAYIDSPLRSYVFFCSYHPSAYQFQCLLGHISQMQNPCQQIDSWTDIPVTWKFFFLQIYVYMNHESTKYLLFVYVSSELMAIQQIYNQ